MKRVKVAMIGTGDLAALFASRMPTTLRKVVISPRRHKAMALADEIGGIAADQAGALRGCAVIVVAAPARIAINYLKEAEAMLEEEVLIVNISPDVPTARLAVEFPALRLTFAKLIGDPYEVAQGAPALLVHGEMGPAHEGLLPMLFSGIGRMMQAPEPLVENINAAVVEAILRSEAALCIQLAAHGVDAVQARTALCALGPGLLRALYNHEADSARARLIERVQPDAALAQPVRHQS